MLEGIEQATRTLASITEGVAALIVLLGIVEALAQLVRGYLRPSAHVSLEPTELARLRLGRWLALALEFALASDILFTAVAPTWQDIGQLAAIVILRTVLNYFLDKEIERAEETRRRAEGKVT